MSASFSLNCGCIFDFLCYDYFQKKLHTMFDTAVALTGLIQPKCMSLLSDVRAKMAINELVVCMLSLLSLLLHLFCFIVLLLLHLLF